MKILMLGWEFPPVFSGGLGVVTKSMAISLGKRGLEICFALPYHIRRSILDSQIPSEFSLIDFKDFVHKISFEFFPTLISSPYVSPQKYASDVKGITEEELREMDLEYFSQTQSGAVYGKNLFEEIDRFARQMEIFARERKFDLIHAHDWITFEAGIRLKPILNIPLLLHVHATEIDRTGGNPNQEVFNREKYAFEFADKIIVVSNYTKNILVNWYGVSPDKIQVVYNAHNPQQDHRTELPDWLIKKDKDDFIVLFIGRVTLQKGPDYFLEIAKKVIPKNKHIKFIIVGEGDMLPQLIRETARERLQNNVFFLGFVDGEQKAEVYENVDLCVVPSVSEPFGLIPLEAVEYGVPVVLSSNSGVKEVVNHSLKADFWDIEKMAHYVLAVAKYPALKKMLSKESFQETRCLNWDDQAGKVHTVYQELLSTK